MYAFSQRAFHLLCFASGARHFATKGRYFVADIIRWNAENKILFGAVLKDTTKQKDDTKKAPQSSSDETSEKSADKKRRRSHSTTKHKQEDKKKPAKTTPDTTKQKDTHRQDDADPKEPTKKKRSGTPKKHTLDNVTEQRLQEMYASSVMMPSLNDQVDDTEVVMVQNKKVYKMAEPDVPEEALVSENQLEVPVEDSAFSDYFPEERTNNVYIPKVLPVPGAANATPAKSSTGSKKNFSSFSAPQKPVQNSEDEELGVYDSPQKGHQDRVTDAVEAAPKEMEFVLNCPVLPPEGEEVFQKAQEFRSVIEKLGLRLLPTVNMVLNKTRSDLSLFFLQRWRQNMIQELGEEGFKKHQENVLWEGTNIHACVQQCLSGVPLSEIQVQESNKGHWTSLQSILPEVTDVQALETPITHPWLFYRGTFDCVAKYKDVLYVIDWKTSSKPKPLISNLYDNPLQVAAYLGAVNLSAEFTSKFGVVDHAAIVVAYQNGQPAHVHRMKPALCQHYWKEWCQRLHRYWAITAAEKGLQSQAKMSQ